MDTLFSAISSTRKLVDRKFVDPENSSTYCIWQYSSTYCIWRKFVDQGTVHIWRKFVDLLYMAKIRRPTVYGENSSTYCIWRTFVDLLYMAKIRRPAVYGEHSSTYCIWRKFVDLLYMAKIRRPTVYGENSCRPTVYVENSSTWTLAWYMNLVHTYAHTRVWMKDKTKKFVLVNIVHS
jgi:hypothetical protein